ncbi:TetR/AcrR family transcriptional regulator [Tsukamurella sp. 8F]|uniref:TetR/AcrR family transcriptional regulator n=1 Tax=unclassified Tsukamurella TaxID=2633480 RepID=UPI0023B99D6F|nr:MULTISPECIES: TetR/AcrR family transcriptional regulator [unclassified Tsukamurella]MDF0531905.1 TetR/AcrR family transcriptional regulator [Tsukamurella sp. 8J]MDF0586955.1 TetR/AcrR family transcriptional regulator [Tsukamurella sp. 8F]
MDGSTRAVGRKVGRKPAFTEEDVIDAALAEGVDRFTLAAVAARIGVVTPAIYRVFRSRDDVVRACLTTLAGTFRLPEPTADWRAVLRLWADESWRLCEEYPGLPRAVYAYPLAVTVIENVVAGYTAVLIDQGWTAGQAAFALDFIGDTVFASHLGIQEMRSTDADGARALDRVRDAAADDAILRPTDSWIGRGVIDTKVDFIITGLEHHRPSL